MPDQTALRPNPLPILGVASCLPIAMMVLLAFNNIVPPFAMPDPAGQVRLSVRVVLLLALFAPLAGLLINLRGAWRGDRGSQVAAGVALAVTLTLATAILVDQWSCFAGVPNCD